MQGTKIVTAVVFLSLTGVGCKAKFTHKNSPISPTASATGPSVPVTPAQPAGPAVPAVPAAPVDEPVTPVQVAPPGGPQPQPPFTQPPYTPQLGCPTSSDASLDPRRVIQKKTIVFKRGRQMIWRKNCEGVVYSKRYENLTAATSQLVRINSTGRGGSIMIFNRTTCDSPGIQARRVLPTRDGQFVFSASTQGSNNSMLVKPGRNYIDYEIPGGEKGTLILTVKVNSRVEDCIVIRDRGCDSSSRTARWSDSFFQTGD